MGTKKFYGYKAAIAIGIFSFFVSGPAMMYAYLMPSTMARLNCTAAQITSVNAVYGVISFLGSFIAGKIYTRFGAEKGSMFYGIASVIYAGAFIFAQSLWVLMGSAVIMGLASGVGATAAVSAYIADWFVEKRQEISGYVTAAGTMGGFASGMLFSFLTKSMDVTQAAIVLVVACSAICLVSAFFLRSRKKMEQLPLGYVAEADTASEASVVELTGPDVKETVKSISFWLFCAGILISCLGVFYLSCATMIMTGAGMDISLSSRIFSMVTLAMGVGSILMGNLFSKLGCKKALVVVFGVAIASLSGIAYWCSNPASVVLIAIASFGFGIADSGLILMAVMSYSELFGMKSFNQLMPIMGAIGVAGATGGSPIMSLIYDLFGNWTAPTVLSIILMGLGALCVGFAFIFSPMKKRVK